MVETCQEKCSDGVIEVKVKVISVKVKVIFKNYFKSKYFHGCLHNKMSLYGVSIFVVKVLSMAVEVI